MTVRGAPAIGAAAAFAMAQAARESAATDARSLLADLSAAAVRLRAARPTAVNLAWAVERQLECARETSAEPAAIRAATLTNAQAIADADVAANRRIGQHGASLIADGATVLHHCNTGALATVDYGTALGVVRAAHEAGRRFHVLLDETRPRLQGSRLSAWELEQLGVSYDILPDSALPITCAAAKLTSFSSAPIASRPMAISPIRSAPIRWRCWPLRMPCPFTLSPPLRRWI